MFRIRALKTYKSKTPEVLKFWKLNGLCTIMKLVTVIYIAKLFETIYIPGADHILAQPLKPCSASLIEPKETFVLAKYRQNILCFGVYGGRISLCCCQVTSKVPKTLKNLFVLQFYSWDGSFRHGEMKIWLCLYFQHVTRSIGTDFVGESRRNMQRSEKEHLFCEGCFGRKEYISNTANKRCSRQVLQLRYSSSYSIKVYT